MKVENIRSKITEIEKNRKEEQKLLKDVVAEAEEAVRRAEDDISKAKDTIDLEAFKEASGEKWLAEMRADNAKKNLESHISDDKEELESIKSDLDAEADKIKEDVDKFRKKLLKEINEKVEELRKKEADLASCYFDIDRLSGKELNIYTFKIYEINRLSNAKYELEDHNPFFRALPYTVDANGMPVDTASVDNAQSQVVASAESEPKLLAQPAFY